MKSGNTLPNIIQILSLFVILLGVAVLIGWKLEISLLKSIFPGQITMKPNTAIAIILSGIATTLLLYSSSQSLCKYLLILIAAVVIVLATLTFSEYFFQVNLNIDQLIFFDSTNALNPGRMSPTSALCFLNVAIALIFTSLNSFRFRKPIIAGLSTTVIFIAGLVLCSYIPNLLFGYRILDYTNMGIHTALAFMLLGISLLIFLKKEGDFNWSLNTFITSGCVLGLISLLAVTAFYFNFIKKLEYSDQQIEETQQATKNLNSILTTLASLEKAEYNYVITRDKFFLKEINRHENSILYDLKNKLVLNNSIQSQINKLKQQIILELNKNENIIQPNSLQKINDTYNNIFNFLKQIREKIENWHTQQLKNQNFIANQAFLLSPLGIFLSITLLSIGIFILNSGIEERKRIEQQLRHNQKMAAIGQLSGGIAHDFNNILGIILGNLELLERRIVGNEEAIKRVKTILKAATRGADFTKRLLAFSRLQQLTPLPTVLENSINNLVEMATQTLGPEIKITTQLDKSLQPVFVDPGELESALLNLLVNARDAMPNGGKLVITAQSRYLDNTYLPVQTGEVQPGDYACISVTDTGHGIPSEILERVFEPFFTTKERGKGTGMGLSMVYGFVKQSGGIIRIYSEVNHGTTISLYLPFAKGYQSIKKQTMQIEKPTIGGKVLVVDDEPDLLDIAGAYLKEIGFEVFYATNGESALATFKSTPDIKLLITDIIMPGEISGIKLAKEIKNLKKDIIVIYTSGFPLDILLEKKYTKIEPLINKPYQRDEFINVVKEAMTNQFMLQN